nr:F-box only protein 7-like isoform X3 [Dermacentor andersoni]
MSSLGAGKFGTKAVSVMREQARPQYCYQVQDFTMPLPKQLEDLHMTCNINHPREALALAVHVLMTEVGFELEGWQETLPDGSTRDHPATENFFWDRSDCLMKIGYSHPTCPAVSFLVAFVLFDPSVIIHGLVAFENNTEGFSLNLRISDFIQKAFLSDPEPNKVYKNLPSLSRVVKDSVALPLLGWAQSVTNVAPTFGFMTLSSEIQLLILGYLNVRDLLAASRVNTDLFELASHPVLWRKLFLKNFPSVEVSPTDNVSDWRERYKREYLLRKEQQEHALRILPRMQCPRLVTTTSTSTCSCISRYKGRVSSIINNQCHQASSYDEMPAPSAVVISHVVKGWFYLTSSIKISYVGLCRIIPVVFKLFSHLYLISCLGQKSGASNDQIPQLSS